MKIKISTDSISDLPKEILIEQDIPVMPLLINMGDDSFEDDEAMPEKIYEFVSKTKKLPKTAARSVEDYISFFNTHKPEGGELVHFTISSKLSASFAMASEAAKQLEGVFVVDTLSLSSGSGLLVLYAVDLREEGKSAAEIADACFKRTASVQASFCLDSLSYLHKGGRCSGLALFIASIFKIKPIIKVLPSGKMGAGKRYRGKFSAVLDKYVDDILGQFNTPDLKRAFITYTTADTELIKKVRERVLARYPFETVYETVASGTITSHCGKNTLGILYFNDGEKREQ